METLRKAGFFKSTLEPDLPMPVSQAEPVEREFIELLKVVEALKAESVGFRGFSFCRFCNRANGSREFTLDGWVWPSGYVHYLEAHNVHPSADFKSMIERYGKFPHE